MEIQWPRKGMRCRPCLMPLGLLRRRRTSCGCTPPLPVGRDRTLDRGRADGDPSECSGPDRPLEPIPCISRSRARRPARDPPFRRVFGRGRFRPCHLRARGRHAFPRIPHRLERGSHLGVRGRNASDLGPTPALLVQFKPSTAREESGRATVAQSSRSPGLPAIATARQLCDDQDHLVWALSAPDSTTFQIVELRRPPRLLVDLLHQEAESAPDPGSTTGGYSGRAGNRGS